MLVRVLVVGFVIVVVAVVSVVAIVMSTSKGSDWSEAVWKSLDNEPPDSTPRAGPDHPDEAE